MVERAAESSSESYMLLKLAEEQYSSIPRGEVPTTPRFILNVYEGGFPGSSSCGLGSLSIGPTGVSSYLPSFNCTIGSFCIGYL